MIIKFSYLWGDEDFNYLIAFYFPCGTEALCDQPIMLQQFFFYSLCVTYFL